MAKTTPCLAILLVLVLSPVDLFGSTVLVTTAGGISADGTINWGAPNAILPNPSTFAVTGIPGLNATVAQPGGPSFSVDVQSPTSWNGNFTPGDPVLANNAPGPVSITFSSPVAGVGTQIQALFHGPFTASIQAFDSLNNLLGTFTEPGTSNTNADGSAIFIGILSNTADISRITLSTPIASGLLPGMFGINNPIVQANGSAPTVVPEPSSVLLWSVVGLVTLGSKWRRRRVTACAQTNSLAHQAS